ncbi:MAG: VOC family protein [Cyclobacteriaceae bacterium]|nr:VOC family protein [Cyclobacteriaceae bacterium]
MKNIFSYVAIPSDNFERAFKFYFEITDGLIKRNLNIPFPMAYFVDKENNDVGHLFQLPNFKPSANGAIVYLKLTKVLNDTLAKIENAGGKIVMAKTQISPPKGYWALFHDPEGNKLALHSNG